MNSQANRAGAECRESFTHTLWTSLHLLMFVSGALALVYEILWMRRFAAVFGATTPAVAAVLASVFLGFTAGSLVIGARAARFLNPVRAYGLLEIGAGLGALLVEPLLNFYEHGYPWLYRLLSGSPAGFFAVKIVLAMVALFIPTFCMGGTVPLLGHAAASRQRRLGISAGGLYAANVVGAALGALSVPFLWLPNVSARTTYGICIVVSLLIGVVAFCLRSGDAHHVSTKKSGMKAAVSPTGKRGISIRQLASLAGLSGLLLFILQVVWSRMFAQVHENSIYSFAVVLAVLLTGLAGGALCARRLLQLGHAPRRLLGVAWMSAGIAVCVTPQLFYSLTNGLSYLEGNGGWASYGLRILGLTLPTVFVPSLLSGMALPLLMEMSDQSSDQPSGRVLGWIIGVNTVGSILGSLVAAFLLPAWIGLWMSLALVGVAMMAVGDWCLGAGTMRRAILAGCVAGWFVLSNPANLPRTKFRAEQGEKLLDLKESSHGILAIVEKGLSRRIKLNNFYVLGGTASTGDERLQAHLPLFLHPAPKRVAFLGLGTGITAGAALLHPVERVTVVEIVPEVIAAAREHFSEANLQVIDSPRIEVIAEDARNFLQGTSLQFDVIVGDLFVPWHRGEASLYTFDQFAAARRALVPGGIFCQWLPMFQLSEEEFNIVTATFLDVFPHATLWRGDFAPGQPAMALIGQLEPDAAMDSTVVERRLRELKPDDANPTLAHPAGFWMFLAGSLDPTEERFSSARRNRENEPWLEVLGPLNHAGSTRGRVSLFVGRRLEAFLEGLRARPTGGTPLASLDAASLQWRFTGAKLAEISLLTAEGKHREAVALHGLLVPTLPPEIRVFFDGASSPPPGTAQ